MIPLLLTGCVKNVEIDTLTSVQRERVNSIQIREDGTNRNFVALKFVEASGCQKGPFHSRLDAEDEAKRNLQINAAALGADAVIGVTCEPKLDWFTSCWNLYVCKGDAIRFTQ